MKLLTLTTLLTALQLTTNASALGINCQGSTICSSYKGTAGWLKSFIDGIDGNRWYNNGQKIACYNGSEVGANCAFFQKMPGGGGWGWQAKYLAHYIPEHGCSACGSVPMDFPNGNDVGKGELTFNVVSSACRSKPGLC